MAMAAVLYGGGRIECGGRCRGRDQILGLWDSQAVGWLGGNKIDGQKGFEMKTSSRSCV
jgi:hypothetical protein